MMDKPGIYRIKVRGVLPESWLDRMGGMRITAKTLEEVTLEGRLSDQAALNGVLETLYSLRLPILEVTRLPEQPPDTKTDFTKGQAP